MFCPKCGTDNADANKYCRACRANLKVVAQALEQRLPVVLASKIDQMLDSRSEGFRRDAILIFLMGIIAVIAGALGEGPRGFNKSLIFSGVLIFLYGLWEYLAYKRSLAPDFDWDLEAKPAPLSATRETGEIVTLGINTEAIAGSGEAAETAKMSLVTTRQEPASVTEETTRHLDAHSPNAGTRQ